MKYITILVFILSFVLFSLPGCFVEPEPEPEPTPIPTAPPLNTDLIQNGDFSDGFSWWWSWVNTDAGADASFAVVDEVLYCDVVSGQNEFWYIQAGHSDLYLEQYYSYVLAFDAWAEAVREIDIGIGEDGVDNNGDENDYTTYDSCRFSITESMTTYSIDLKMLDIDDPVARLVFNFGNNENDVYLDNVSLVKGEITIPGPGTELIVNGDFSDGVNNWGIGFSNGADAVLTVESEVLHVDILTSTSLASDIRVGQSDPGFVITTGRNYRLTFDAWADADRTIDSSIWENGHDLDGNDFAWSPHAIDSYSITTTQATYTFDFTTAHTNYDAGLSFFCSNGIADIYIDNVSIIELP